MRCVLGLLLALLTSAAASGQIVVAETTAAFKPIVGALADELPEGADLKVSWRCTDGDVILAGPTTAHVWAPPGKHTLSCRGFWIKTKMVTLPDGEKFVALLGIGPLDYEAPFTVTEAGPNPPPPPPPGKRWGVIIEETNNRTPRQFKLQAQLRSAFKSGPKFWILDQDSPDAQSYRSYVEGLALPALLVFADNGQLVSAAPCPDNLAAIKKALGL